MRNLPSFHRLAFVAVFAVLLSCLQVRSNITYSLVNYPGDQNGWMLSGNITTDGKLGSLTGADIISWEWNVTSGYGTYSYSSLDPGAFFGQLSLPPDLIATSTNLSVPSGQGVGLQDDSDVGYPTILEWMNNWNGSDEYVAQIYVPPTNVLSLWITLAPSSLINSHYVIATAVAGTITFFHEPAMQGYLVGHAFLSVTAPNGVTQYYGFYPATSAVIATPGIISSVDSSSPWDFKIEYPITQAQFQSIAAEITRDCSSQLYYSIVGFNCMSFVASIANAGGIQLPNYLNSFGIADPATFGISLANIGNGNIYTGGTVVTDDPVDPITPFDYSYSGIETLGHTNAVELTADLGLVLDSLNLGAFNANISNGISLYLRGSITTQDIISVKWGDGSLFQAQATNFKHLYTPGTYLANVLVVDAGAVHSYNMTNVVSSAIANSITINVAPFPAATNINQGLVSAVHVPDFSVAQITALSLLPNDQANIYVLGISNWTYSIEETPNLSQPFIQIGTATADTNGMLLYQDKTATNSSRFYRIAYP